MTNADFGIDLIILVSACKVKNLPFDECCINDVFRAMVETRKR